METHNCHEDNQEDKDHKIMLKIELANWIIGRGKFKSTNTGVVEVEDNDMLLGMIEWTAWEEVVEIMIKEKKMKENG